MQYRNIHITLETRNLIVFLNESIECYVAMRKKIPNYVRMLRIFLTH